MTLFKKYLNYAKNICELKKGYNLDNARKYFGKDYSNFVVFYMTFREAKETVRHNKEALTVRQMQYIGSLLKQIYLLTKEHEKQIDRFEQLSKDSDEVSNLLEAHKAVAIDTKVYGAFFQNLNGRQADAYEFYSKSTLSTVFDEQFGNFVNDYYSFDLENHNWRVNLKVDKYLERVNKIENSLIRQVREKLDTAQEKLSVEKQISISIADKLEETTNKVIQAQQEMNDLIASAFL